MVIRRATMMDLNAVSSLYEVLFQSSGEYEPTYYQKADMDEEEIKETLFRQTGDILIAEEGESVIGFVALKEMQTQPNGGIIPLRYAYVADVVVHPDHQEKGVGTALMDSAKKWAARRRLDYLELRVLDRNVGARKLYRRSGFRTVLHTMRCPLD